MSKPIPGWRVEHALKLRELLAQRYGVNSIRALGRHIRMNASYLGEILNGRRGVSYRTMERFAKALNTSVEEILRAVGWSEEEAGAAPVPPPPARLNEETVDVLVAAVRNMPLEVFYQYRQVAAGFLVAAGRMDRLVAEAVVKLMADPATAAEYLENRMSDENRVVMYHALGFFLDPVAYSAAGNYFFRPLRVLRMPQEVKEKIEEYAAKGA